MGDLFSRLSTWVALQCGRPVAFLLALAIVLGWAATGPYFEWSDSHSLFVNTVTTVVTFLMVFLIQSTQNRDTKAMELKLDELIRAIDEADNRLIGIERASEEVLVAAQQKIAEDCKDV